MSRPTERDFRTVARELTRAPLHPRDVLIDADAEVNPFASLDGLYSPSRPDPERWDESGRPRGAWVRAWIWVAEDLAAEAAADRVTLETLTSELRRQGRPRPRPQPDPPLSGSCEQRR